MSCMDVELSVVQHNEELDRAHSWCVDAGFYPPHTHLHLAPINYDKLLGAVPSLIHRYYFDYRLRCLRTHCIE